MDADTNILRKVRLAVANKLTKDYTWDDNQHTMAEECLAYAADKYGFKYCDIQSVEIDGNYREPIYYLNTGDIYDQTVYVHLFAAIAGGHKIKVGSIGAILERSLA